MKKMSKNLPETLDDLAVISEHLLQEMEYLSVYALNYTYVNFETLDVVVMGTEADWLAEMMSQGLHLKVEQRLRNYSYSWTPDYPQALYQAYEQYRKNNEPASATWLKTDFALKGAHGYHLLEIGHTQELGIDTYNQMVDVLNYFKYESMRLQKKYPLMVSKLAHLDAIETYQAIYQDEEQATLAKMTLNFDESLFEPLPEPVLTEQEHQALELRVQWFEDDEIADQMQLSIREVKKLFVSVKDKYHQPRIPQFIYQEKRRKVFSDLGLATQQASS